MADKGFFIETLPREGVVTFLALVREKEPRPTRNGGLLLHLALSDRTGELDAEVWECPRDAAALFGRDARLDQAWRLIDQGPPPSSGRPTFSHFSLISFVALNERARKERGATGISRSFHPVAPFNRRSQGSSALKCKI